MEQKKEDGKHLRKVLILPIYGQLELFRQFPLRSLKPVTASSAK